MTTKQSNKFTTDGFEHQVSYSIQCFTINPTGTKAIVTGKTHYNLFSIDDNKFTFKASYKHKSVLCLMDVAWSPHDENRVVSCGSNGELYTLNVTESEIVNTNPDVTVMFHKPTINKVNFHPNKNYLISGGHDGTIKLTDFRCTPKSTVSFHHDLEDKVTDCQFSPLIENCFASGSANGFVYIWDDRNTSAYIKKLNPHLPGQVHVDWHPEKPNILASASFDRQISVLNIDEQEEKKSKEEKRIKEEKKSKEDKHLPTHYETLATLTHSESVTSIKWRPNRPRQITACSSNGFDAHLYVWDLIRPYVPYYSFDKLLNKVQNFMWKANSPNTLIAATRDTIIQTTILDAIRPADYSSLIAVQMDKHGSVAFAVGVGEKRNNDVSMPMPTTKIAFGELITNEIIKTDLEIKSVTGSTENNNSNDNNIENDIGSFKPGVEMISSTGEIAGSHTSISVFMTNLFNKAGSNSSADQLSNFSDAVIDYRTTKNFEITKSLLYFDTRISANRSDWFEYSANNYKFKDLSFEALCDHNAQVAIAFNRFNIYKDWMILKTIFKSEKKYETQPTIAYAEPRSSAFNIHSTNSASNSNLTAASNPLIRPQQSTLDIENNLTKMKINPQNFLSVNTSPSSSSSSSAPASSSMNENSSRIRHFSENDSNEANPMLQTQGKSSSIPSANFPTSAGNSDPNDQNNYEQTNEVADFRQTPTINFDLPKSNEQDYFSSNNLLNVIHADSNNHPIIDHDDYFPVENQINKYDDEDLSTLPNDVLEYNDDLKNEYFINTKYSKSINHDFKKHTNKQQFMDEDQTLNFLRNNKPSLQQTRPTTDIFFNRNSSSHQKPNTSNLSTATLTNSNTLLLQPVSVQSDNITNSQNVNNDEICFDYGSAQSNSEKKTVVVDDNFLKSISTTLAQQNMSIFSKMDFNNYFQQLLINYINIDSDLGTAIFMYLVTSQNDKFEQNKIDSKYLDEWFSQYIEILAKFEMWNIRIEIIKAYQSEFIRNLTQNSLSFTSMCATCKKIIKPNTYMCPSCNKNVFLCSYCHLPVKRLYIWCSACCHGGHLNHMTKWFKNNTKCPSGCGCNCRYD